LAILQSNGDKGNIMITASAEGLTSSAISIEAK